MNFNLVNRERGITVSSVRWSRPRLRRPEQFARLQPQSTLHRSRLLVAPGVVQPLIPIQLHCPLLNKTNCPGLSNRKNIDAFRSSYPIQNHLHIVYLIRWQLLGLVIFFLVPLELILTSSPPAATRIWTVEAIREVKRLDVPIEFLWAREGRIT